MNLSKGLKWFYKVVEVVFNEHLRNYQKVETHFIR